MYTAKRKSSATRVPLPDSTLEKSSHRFSECNRMVRLRISSAFLTYRGWFSDSDSESEANTPFLCHWPSKRIFELLSLPLPVVCSSVHLIESTNRRKRKGAPLHTTEHNYLLRASTKY